MKIDFNSFTKKYIRPPQNLFPVGSIVFKGFQGSGKTLSMVHYLFQLKKQFPKCHIYSNVIIKGLDYTLIENDDDVALALSDRNASHGVAVLLDEAHLFFNKKKGISLDVLTAISQQRKDRRRIIMSSQIWEELDISLRKQVKHIVSCHSFGYIQINTIYDGETLTWDKMSSAYTAKKIYTEVFKHNKDLYNSYDTYQKIIKNNEYERTTSTIQPTSITIQNQLKNSKLRKQFATLISFISRASKPLHSVEALEIRKYYQ